MGSEPGLLRLGLIAYADDTGLGSQTKAYFDNLRPAKTMVLDRSGDLKSARECHPERYPGATVVGALPDFDQVDAFLRDIDVVLMAECAPTQHLMREARRRCIKTAIVPNWEYFHNLHNSSLEMPDLLLAPSLWHFDDYPGPKVYLPFPIEQVAVGNPVDTVHNFVHVAGLPISPDRNGTESVLRALEKIAVSAKFTIFCQKPAYIEAILHNLAIKVPENVELVVRTPVKTTDELYEDQQVLIMPRRFGGLCLPVNEALGHGLPVLMPNISPNNEWLPKPWLMPATKIDERKMASMIDIYDVDPAQIANWVNVICTHPGFYREYLGLVDELVQLYSWEALLPKYIATLTSML